MMGDGKALQAGTSHNLGQNFAKAFEIRYLDKGGVLQHCWTTSWGLSTRFIGAIIMVHGDDQGLILPPRLAPYPDGHRADLQDGRREGAACSRTRRKSREQLVDAGIRVKMDEREGQSPGFKFNDWEMRGVPLRMELGPKDVAKGTVVLARRDRPGKEGKAFVPQQGIAAAVAQMLEEIQKALYERALAFREANTAEPPIMREFKKAVEKGFACSWWCGASACEEKIKEETKATMRCIPVEQPGSSLPPFAPGAGQAGKCIYCGAAAREKAIFARAY